ncbi:MAG: putative rane protein [Bacillales bacterium]|jgi:ABC-2 type transport system permease protein|nr:putative rane protein [Bacillales bacterium]
MNIIIKELKSHRKSLIIWSIGVIFMISSGMGKYVGLSSSGQSMNDLMADMPKSMQVIMGTGSLDLSKASGYYGILFLYLVLMGTIHSAMLGSNIIAKEERDKTSEFLFVKPISRTKIVMSKLAAALINIILFNFVTLVTSILLVQKYGKGEEVTRDIIMLMLGLFLLQVLFLSIGTAIAAAKKNSKTATSLSTGILLFTFILSIIIDLNEKIENLKFLTPFKYFEPKNILYGGQLDSVYIVLSLVISFILISITFVSYNKRDLSI